MKAVEFVEATSVADAKRILADYAAAGLLKPYARIVETVQPNGNRTKDRGGTIPTDLWRQMISEGVVEDVWAGGPFGLQRN